MVERVANLGVSGNLRRYWWLFLIRGLLGIVLGFFALAFPGATLAVAVLLIGAYMVVDGVIAIVKAMQILRSDPHWWVLLLEGLLGVVVGIAIFAWPGLSILSLAYLVGYWAIISGAFTITAALRLRTHVPGEWLYLVFGIVSIVFGAFVLFAPGTGLVYIVLMISIYGFVMGITMLALAFQARRMPA